MAKKTKKKGTDEKKKKKGFGSAVTDTVKRNTEDLREGRAVSLEELKRDG